MTQADLAEKADLSTNYVGEIERGESQPTLESPLAVADALQVNPSSLFVPLDRLELTDPELRLDKDEILRRVRELMEALADLP